VRLVHDQRVEGVGVRIRKRSRSAEQVRVVTTASRSVLRALCHCLSSTMISCSARWLSWPDRMELIPVPFRCESTQRVPQLR